MPSRLDTPRSDLAGPELRRAIADYVRRRIPAADVDDVVQTVLCDALAADKAPGDPSELKRWVMGIARHKVADFHRRAQRERPEDLDDVEAQSAPLEARAMVEWAEQQVEGSGEQHKTLEWMAREGEGEKLEAIAADERLPATRIRQRVSRMRRWMRQRWTAELAAVAALVVLGVLVWRWLRPADETPTADETPAPTPTATTPDAAPRARELRRDAMALCGAGEWEACLDRLDRASELDPDGDQAPPIAELRRQATEALDQRREDERREQEEPRQELTPEQDPKEQLPPPPPTSSPKAPGPPPYQAPPPKAPPFEKKPDSKLDFPSEPPIQQQSVLPSDAPLPTSPPPESKAPPPAKPLPPMQQKKSAPKGGFK